MGQKLRFEWCDAKAQVYEACADYLGTRWTRDMSARIAGKAVAVTLRKRAAKWRRLATRRAKEEGAAADVLAA